MEAFTIGSCTSRTCVLVSSTSGNSVGLLMTCVRSLYTTVVELTNDHDRNFFAYLYKEQWEQLL